MFNYIVIYLTAMFFAVLGSVYKIPHASFSDCLTYVSIGVFCYEFTELKKKIEKV